VKKPEDFLGEGSEGKREEKEDIVNRSYRAKRGADNLD
jgi:hypothetical protein